MISKYKKIIKDTLFVSKITKTNNKKLLILFSVSLSQLIALTDILIILFFTYIFTPTESPQIWIIQLEPFFKFKLLLPLIIILRYLFQYSQNITLKKLEHNVQNNLRRYMIEEVFNKKNYSVSDAYYYINQLSTHISFFYTSIANFLNFLLQSLAFSIFLFLSEPETILSFLLGILFLIYPISYLIKKAREYMHITYELGQTASDEIQKIVENMFLIKLLKKEKDEVNRFSDIVINLNKNKLQNHKFSILNGYLPSFVTIFILSIISLYFSSFFNITLSFVGITLRMFQALSQLSSSINQVINSHVHLEKFYELQMAKVDNFSQNYIQNFEENDIAINLSKVSFKYLNSDDYIFKDLEMEIKQNNHVVITGSNGSGKSTLLGLMAGVYDPVGGTIVTNSNNFGFVGPTPLIFTDTLKKNFLYGNKKQIKDEEIITLAIELNLFGDKKDIDLNMKVSNKLLSSGQMQKISFIRAFLSDVDILFLDESTSNLDDESAEFIFNKISEKKITVINSTHNIEKFKKVDEHFRIVQKDGVRVLKKII